MSRTRPRRLMAVLLVAGAIGCQAGLPGEDEESREAFKARMKEIEERIKESMPKTQETALRQEVDADTVRAVQEKLVVLREYLDEPSGELDFVTVNAVMAFQRQVGLTDDGLLDEKTLQRLDQEAAKVGAGNEDYFRTGYYAG